jgi:hypothetical protein
VYRGDTLRWHHSGLASIREVDSWHLNGERTKTSTLGVHAVASLFGIVVALHVYACITSLTAVFGVGDLTVDPSVRRTTPSANGA